MHFFCKLQFKFLNVEHDVKLTRKIILKINYLIEKLQIITSTKLKLSFNNFQMNTSTLTLTI